jgi:hypothetical protein
MPGKLPKDGPFFVGHPLWPFVAAVIWRAQTGSDPFGNRIRQYDDGAMLTAGGRR